MERGSSRGRTLAFGAAVSVALVLVLSPFGSPHDGPAGADSASDAPGAPAAEAAASTGGLATSTSDAPATSDVDGPVARRGTRSSKIVGRVLDASRRPVAGARVSATDALADFGPRVALDGSAGTATDDRGRFEIEPPCAASSFAVVAAARGVGFVFAPGVRRGEPTDLVLEGGARVVGVVIGRGARPIEGADVTVAASCKKGSVVARAKTDSEGRFDVAGLPVRFGAAETCAFVLVSAEGHMSVDRPVALTQGKVSEVSIALGHGATLRGLVHDEEDGKPVARARVRVLPPSADSSKPTRHPEDETTLGAGEADVRGRFVLSSVPAVGAVGGEEHRLLVEAEGFLPTTETLPMAYEDGIQTTLVELARAHPFEIDVLVKAGDTPVAGARLVATSRHDWSELFAMQEPGPLAPGAETPLRGVTGPDGRARLGPFQGPARGAAVRVLVTHPNGPTARELSARPGPGPHRLAIQVGGADDFTRIVEGVVVLCDGDPAAGVPVRVEGVLKNGGAEVRTGADGRFRVPVPVDSWRIRASAPGFVSTTAEMAEVGADGLLRLVLEPGHVVTGRVVDREGAPVPWIDVAVFDEAVPHAELEFHALFTAHTSCIPLDIVETLLDGPDYVVSEPPVPPLREGSLTAPSPLQSAKTGADGRFRFFDLPATVGLCAAYVTGWEQRRPRSHAAVHVAARGEDEIEIRLDLLAPPGKPPESPPVDEGKRDVVVTLLGPETQRPHERGQSAWLLPDGQKKWIAGAIEGFGRVRFPAIPVGSCRYWADGRDIRVVDCVLEIPNGDGAFETTVRTEPCATVVVLLQGEPVDARDVTLELRPATGDNENWYRAYATEGDRLVAGGAPAGRYWLNAWVLGRPELTTALPYGIDVPEEGTVQTTLRLVRGGRVLLNVDRTAAPPVRDSDGDLCATWPACRARIVDAGGTLRWCGDLAMAREYSPDANDALVRRTQIVDIVLPPGGYTAFLEASGADVASGGFDLRRDACTSVVVAFPSPR